MRALTSRDTTESVVGGDCYTVENRLEVVPCNVCKNSLGASPTTMWVV